ncbi:helix-turn-helix domain-containing protein [Chryseobacterium sp. MMS23-Vi53]|uniref:helix-turn-helix domain-containing protein n=1 Tax=Chryseobacterium sp. MMS23-Vi53 TaxID=3386644 RepID=UPI0039E7F80B
MTKHFYLLLILIFGISCSSTEEKQKKAEESFQKKEIAMLDYLEFSGNPKLIIKTANESKQLAKKIHYDYGIFKCNMSLIYAFNATGKYKEATLVGKENDELAKKIKVDYIVCLNYTNVANAYSYMGLLDEAENYLNKALKYNDKLENNNDKYYSLGVIYSGFAYIETMKGESSPNLKKVEQCYLKQLHALQKVNDNDKKIAQKKNAQLSMLYLNLGSAYDQMQKDDEALKYFHKSLYICKKYQFTNTTPLFANTSIALLFDDQKKYDSSMIYAQKAIVLEKTSHSPEVRRDLYQVLHKASLAKGDQKNSEKYTNLYMKLNDSLINVEKRAINTPVKNIIKAKEEDHKSNLMTILTIIGSAILILSAIVFFLWRRNQKIQHAKYEKVINQLKQEEKRNISEGMNIQEVYTDKSLNIHDDTVNSILQKLNKFENSERFLKKDKTLTSLANSLDTNPRYLSEIIKQYKGKNFNNYLNGLRIHHITQLLYKEPIYREYKITYLAEHCGFASREVFAIAFKKETGVTPSYFINQLRSEEALS